MASRIVFTSSVTAFLFGFSLPAFVTAEAPATKAHYYSYFKQKKTLTLDVHRVAFLHAPAEDGSAASVPKLAAFGIDDATVAPMAIRGWALGGTTAANRTEADVERTVREIAKQQVVDFVSPVFVDDYGGPMMITPHILVGFDRQLDPARAEAILTESGAGAIVDRDWANMKRAYRLKSSSRDGFEVLAAANRLAERSEVMFAEPDMIFTGRGSLIPDDPGFGDCWGLHNTGQFGGIPGMDMDAPEAWDTTIGDPSIIVVIIDTGLEQDHPDLNQVPGNDLTGDPSASGDPVNECDNHGTAVAGCVSATIDNALGTVGVAPGAKSASARTFISNLSCTGTWSSESSWTVDTLTWAESIGARVTNNSNYYGIQSSTIAQKYEDTRSAGMVHFAIAGNFAQPTLVYPGSLPSVNAVAALNPDGTLASFSSFGPDLDFSAPGTIVYTTDRTGFDGYSVEDYVFVQGTSFATPYTAGVAALALSVNPALTACQVEEVLRQSAVDLGQPAYDTLYGWGFVNAAEAVQLAANPPPSLRIAATPVADPVGIKTRYLSFRAEPGRPQAVRMTFDNLPAPFGYANGRNMWVGQPVEYSEIAGRRFPVSGSGEPTFWGATLECDPVFTHWPPGVMVHLFHESLVPGGGYLIQAIDQCASLDNQGDYSAPLSVQTSRWGDAVGTFDIVAQAWRPADGAVNITSDVTAVLAKFANRSTAPNKPRSDLEPDEPDQLINISDVTRDLDAFRNLPYPFSGPPLVDPCGSP